MREETITIQGLQVSYKTAGEGPAVLILHGWGSSSDRWESVQVRLAQEGYKVIIPDLPGFGSSVPPLDVWGVKEYAEFVSHFVKELDIQRFFLVCHSFGGQIALQFTAEHPDKIEGLVLLAAAGIRRNPGAKENILRFLAKPMNMVLSLIPSLVIQNKARRILYRMVGKSDYANAKGVMKEIMTKVVREDLTFLFPRITARTLIIWGDKDKITPLEDAFLMKKYIKDSFLSILPGVGHRLRAEAPEKLTELILQFLKK